MDLDYTHEDDVFRGVPMFIALPDSSSHTRLTLLCSPASRLQLPLTWYDLFRVETSQGERHPAVGAGDPADLASHQILTV
jgi:hypothetical protein